MHISPRSKQGSVLGNIEQTPQKAINARKKRRAKNTSPFCCSKGAGCRLQARCSPGDPKMPMAKASSQHSSLACPMHSPGDPTVLPSALWPPIHP